MKWSLLRVTTWWARRRAKLAAQAARAERPDEGIGAEAPIRTASEDGLRRTDFAAHIAVVLSELSLREGRVFAIRGGWGFGKSSLKNLVTEQLDARRDTADWVDFNPWQWGDGDAIARALFGQIADRLGGEHSRSAVARAEALRRYGAILTGSGAPFKKASASGQIISTVLTNASVIAVATAVGLHLPTAAAVAAGLAFLAVAVPFIGRLLLHLGRDRTGEPLGKVREALETRLRELDRPLIVFVDDLDRLEPKQIRMLLRQVKANANLPNIVFVLLFQPNIVERALDPVANGDGRAFLEKIVQANFDLPATPTSTVHQIFGEELGKLVSPYATEANGFSQTRWGNALIGSVQPLLRNLRDARRLLSSVSIHMPLHSADGVFEVNIIDFLVLEALRVFEPDLHAALFRERELVLQEFRFGQGRRDADKAAAERLLELLPERRRETAKAALKELFPTLEWAYGGTYYAEDFHAHWLTAKRVCTTRYFPRYFELQTADGEMSESRFVAFLDATGTADALSSAIEEIEQAGLLPSLAARIDESVSRLPIENAQVLLPALFRIAEKFAGGNLDPFRSPWISAWRAVTWFLKRVPEELRGDLALAALRETEALSVAAILIHLNDPADRKEGTDETFDPTLDLDTVAALKDEWLRLVRSRAANGTLYTAPDLVNLLYRWRDYSGSLDGPREWMLEAIRTDDSFAEMASRLMSRGTRYSAGDRVASPHNTFSRQAIEDFIGIDLAKERSDALDPAQYPAQEEALRVLRRSLALWLGLRKPDPFEV
ncbi:KAP family P-loop NTPase fold protein [Ralstonia sp. 22086]|uniref:KAP family P-loop NTPase fold protein n=1 Tax=Ralstonia sp. 22086 TaxID=3453870 RepID=UPI003F841107